MPPPMPEIPSRAPMPQQNDDAELLEDIAQAAENGGAPESTDARASDGLRALFPALPASDLESLLDSLRDAGMLDRVVALTSDPAK